MELHLKALTFLQLKAVSIHFKRPDFSLLNICYCSRIKLKYLDSLIDYKQRAAALVYTNDVFLSASYWDFVSMQTVLVIFYCKENSTQSGLVNVSLNNWSSL